MIEVIHYHDRSAEKPFEGVIAKSYDEARGLLKNIPENLKVYFGDESSIIPETGVGGFAYSHDTMTIAIDKDFEDKDTQKKDLHGTIFHESFHLAQRFTAEDGYRTAIDSAVYEGCATVFEREYAGILPLWGDYSAHSSEELKSWLASIKEVGVSYFEEEGVWEKWAFYNEELKQRWIVYKTGTWLVDRVLKETGLNILDLQDKTAEEILALHDF